MTSRHESELDILVPSAPFLADPWQRVFAKRVGSGRGSTGKNPQQMVVQIVRGGCLSFGPPEAAGQQPRVRRSCFSLLSGHLQGVVLCDSLSSTQGVPSAQPYDRFVRV